MGLTEESMNQRLTRMRKVLSEEDVMFIERIKGIAIKRSPDLYRAIDIIDRLVAENEELSDKLDAIKKAWCETLIKYNSVAHHFSFVCDEEIELGDAIQALDKLIGGYEWAKT